MWIGQREILKAQEECNQPHQVSMIGKRQTQCHISPKLHFPFLLTTYLDPFAIVPSSWEEQWDWIIPNGVWKVYCTSFLALASLKKIFAHFSSLFSSLICQLYSEDSGRLWGMMEPLFGRGTGHTMTVDLSCLSIPAFIPLCHDQEINFHWAKTLRFHEYL